jgi:hypothetical protein
MLGFYSCWLVGSVRLVDPPRTVGSLFERQHIHQVVETLLRSHTETLHDLAAVRVGDIFTYRMEDASGDVIRLQVRIGLEDLVLTLTCRQERENIGHPRPAYAGKAAALVRVDRDSVEQVGGWRHAL